MMHQMLEQAARGAAIDPTRLEAPDATLFAWWAEYLSVNEEQDALVKRIGEAGGDPGADPRYEVLDHRAIELHNLITAATALTPQGVAVKLRCYAEYRLDFEEEKRAARAPVIPCLDSGREAPEAMTALRAAADLEAALRFTPPPTAARLEWDAIVADRFLKRAAADAHNRVRDAANAASGQNCRDLYLEQERLDQLEYAALDRMMATRTPDFAALAEKIIVIGGIFIEGEPAEELLAELVKDAKHLCALRAAPACHEGDGALLRLFDQWRAIQLQWDADNEPDPEGARWAEWERRYTEACDAIWALPAITPKGALIKTHLALAMHHGMNRGAGQPGSLDRDALGGDLASFIDDVARVAPEISVPATTEGTSHD